MKENPSVHQSKTIADNRSREVLWYLGNIEAHSENCGLDPMLATMINNLCKKYSYFETVKIDNRAVPTAEVLGAVVGVFRDTDGIYEVFRVVEDRYAKGLIRNKPAYLIAALYNRGLGL